MPPSPSHASWLLLGLFQIHFVLSVTPQLLFTRPTRPQKTKWVESYQVSVFPFFNTLEEDSLRGERHEDMKTGRREDRKTVRREDRKTGRQEDSQRTASQRKTAFCVALSVGKKGCGCVISLIAIAIALLVSCEEDRVGEWSDRGVERGWTDRYTS